MTRAESKRFDGDSWDLASSVGATATMVAAARAIASRADGPLISDPYAEPLVRAVGVDVLTRLASGDLAPADLGSTSDSEWSGMQRLADNMAVRTLFYDDFFLDAAAAGITQAVILASGLDSRAYRLTWPAGTTVFEIDQPDVIAFKSRTMAELGAQPTTYRRAVATDLREDWPAALTEAGFDPSARTAWSAEGLLGYLPPDAQDALLDTITALSTPGSRVATESAPTLDPADRSAMLDRFQDIAARWREHGFELDLTELVYFGDRNEPVAYLHDRGWQLSGRTLRELFAAHGLPPFDEEAGGFADVRYVSGTLGVAK
jgi:methyltransferase (TIGR00027 family)